MCLSFKFKLRLAAYVQAWVLGDPVYRGQIISISSCQTRELQLKFYNDFWELDVEKQAELKFLFVY